MEIRCSQWTHKVKNILNTLNYPVKLKKEQVNVYKMTIRNVHRLQILQKVLVC